MRILFVSDEVAPFTCMSETADLVRMLPEQLQESGDFEVRIMMPRYGTISERRNRLHEVIRLSGSQIEADGHKEVLKVKVASIPGIRLQVYFMDNAHFFKRKGIYTDADGTVFPDNAQRALFFSRSVLHTIHKLGWAPDIVHCVGWLSALTPLLLRSEFGELPLFEKAKSVYTPGSMAPDEHTPEGFVGRLPFPAGVVPNGQSISEIGLDHADCAIFPASVPPPRPDIPQLSEDIDQLGEQIKGCYELVQSEITV